jgi:hypothetical protein
MLKNLDSRAAKVDQSRLRDIIPMLQAQRGTRSVTRGISTLPGVAGRTNKIA